MDGPVNERDSIPTILLAAFLFLSFFLSFVLSSSSPPFTAPPSPRSLTGRCAHVHTERTRRERARQECFTTQVPSCDDVFGKESPSARHAHSAEDRLRDFVTASTFDEPGHDRVDRYRTLQDAAEDVVQTEVCSAVYLHHRLPLDLVQGPRSFKISGHCILSVAGCMNEVSWAFRRFGLER